MGMIYTILGSFLLIFEWEGAVIWPQIRPRKIPDIYPADVPKIIYLQN